MKKVKLNHHEPIQTIRLLRRRRQPVLKHQGYLGANLGSDFSPLRSLSERKRLMRSRLERRSEECHRVDMRIQHHLRRNKYSGHQIHEKREEGGQRTWFSSPVK